LSAITGAVWEIQPHQHLIGLFPTYSGRQKRLENVDAAASGLYKTPQLAAGAIPPPLFF
jgi:hypothetical protein